MTGRSRVRRLQRLAAQKLRHFTDEAGGLADEQALQDGQTVDETEAAGLVGEVPKLLRGEAL